MPTHPSTSSDALQRGSNEGGTRLLQVSDDVWVTKCPLRFFGVEIGTRMTVVRLDDGGLWLHSPIELDEGLVAELAALGPVRHIVAPNRFHHLYAGPAHERFGQAALHLAPGLLKKRSDLAAGKEIALEGEPPWGPEIYFHRVGGLRVLGECVFFHAASRTLIVSDLVFNFGPGDPWVTRQFGRVSGTYGKLGCPADLRLLFLADREAFRSSMSLIRSWAFERIVLAHGELVGDDAMQAFEQAFAFLRLPDASGSASSPSAP
ncbi:MAG: DUF4336 domain-containing protein [Myxococcota bacterium]